MEEYTTTWLTIIGRDANLLETKSATYLFSADGEQLPLLKRFLHILDKYNGFWPSKGENPAYNELDEDTKIYLELIGDYFPEIFEYLTIKFRDATYGYKNP